MQQHSFSQKPIRSLVIAAHFDDVEFMAYSAIAESLQSTDKGIAALVITNGAGSARAGKFAHTTDEQMIQLRVQEQIKAAELGQYSQLTMLLHPSSFVAQQPDELIEQISQIIKDTKPEILYTHNPFDKHPTHIAVCKAVVKAVKQLPQNARPQSMIGCEVWRGLDWLEDTQKVPLDTSYNPEFAKKLFGVFETQIAGGKNYGNAVLGRYTSNATFYNPKEIDTTTALSYGIDMTPLIKIDLSLVQFATMHLNHFKIDVLQALE